MKKTILVIMTLILLSSALYAAVFICANDLEEEKLTETKEIDGFTFIATPDKHMTIEYLSDGRESEDGEVFNGRIKLEGSGKVSQRAISFKASKGEILTVWSNSSSKTEARTIVIADASGNQVGAITAPQDGSGIGISEFEIPQDGIYYLWSKKSGINIYSIVCE